MATKPRMVSPMSSKTARRQTNKPTNRKQSYVNINKSITNIIKIREMYPENKIVVIGSCSVDFTTFAPRLPNPGETIHGNKFMTSFGGKGANQCIAAAKLGAKPFMICRLGDDQWGHGYLDNFKSEGVEIEHAKITPNVANGIAQINVAVSGENQIVIVPGANNCLSIEDVNQAKELITDAGILIAQMETPFETTLQAFKLNKGIKLLNAAPANKDALAILPYCTILCVNESEATLLTNLIVDSAETAVPALRKLLEGGCEIVIITLGENGAVYITKDDEPIHVICEKVKAVDTTGAGDAFVGALATYIMTHKNYPFHQIVGAACEVASVSVTKEGTQTSFPTKHNAFQKEYNYVKL